MSLLDDKPLNWNNADLQMLRGVLIAAYPNRPATEDLANTANIEPGTFPLRDNMFATWTSLFDVMALQGKLRTLIEKAAEDKAVAGFHAVFKQMLALPGIRFRRRLYSSIREDHSSTATISATT